MKYGFLSRTAAGVLIAVMLVGCGGGGGGANSGPVMSSRSSSSTSSLPAVAINFSSTGPVHVFVGDNFFNPALSSDGSSVAYSSDNEDVAVVSESGEVVVKSAGTAIITAAQVASEGPSASYTLHAASSSVKVVGWTGKHGSTLDFDGGSIGMDLLRSAEKDCDFVSYQRCSYGQLSTLRSGEAVVDEAATLHRSGYYMLRHGTHTRQFQITAEHFPGTSGASVVEHNNKLWLIGGRSANHHRGIWVSDDGIAWELVLADAPFSSRESAALASFNDRIWLIGGALGQSIEKYEVWSSSDGITWVQEFSNIDFSVRNNHQLLNFDNQLWLIGGREGQAVKYDVWSSKDGLTWVEHAYGEQPFNNGDLKAVSYNNALLLIGSGVVWSTADGEEWHEETSEMYMTRGSSNHLVVNDGQIWWFSTVLSDKDKSGIWSSIDGITWKKVSASQKFLERTGHNVAAFGEALWILAGHIGGGEGGERSDIWMSRDGISWTQQIPTHLDFGVRSEHEVVFYKNEFWMVGGHSREGGIWSSKDGVRWIERLADAGSLDRKSHQLIVFKDKLWLIGGYNQMEQVYLNDIWSSTDGVVWNREVLNAEFSGRAFHQVVEHEDSLLLVGGYGSEGFLGDVWSSTDGINWSQVLVTAPFGGRMGHQVVSREGQLILIGGLSSQWERQNDIWISSDGMIWILQEDVTPFSKRAYHQVVVHDDVFFLIGGTEESYTRKSDVWSSIDGVNWIEVVSTADFPAVYDPRIISQGGYLWMFGGYNEGARATVWRSSGGEEWELAFWRTLNLR